MTSDTGINTPGVMGREQLEKSTRVKVINKPHSSAQTDFTEYDRRLFEMNSADLLRSQELLITRDMDI
jgi:hypothetical protein